MATLKGKWKWTDFPSFNTNRATIEQSINFTYAGKNYTKIILYWHNEIDIQYIDSTGSVITIYNDDESIWYTDNHFIDFGSVEQTVSETFYNQFAPNAEFIEELVLSGNYTQTVKTKDGLFKIYPVTKAKNVIVDAEIAGISSTDVQSGFKELNDKINVSTVSPDGTYPNMTVGTASTSKSINSFKLTNEDLNNIKGADYWGKLYFSEDTNTVGNKPSKTNGFGLIVSQCGSTSTYQLLFGANSSNSSLYPTIWQRTTTPDNDSNWRDWEEIATSYGTYTDMSVGNAKRLDYSIQVSSSSGTTNVGWWKIGKALKTQISTANNYSAIFLVNGIYGNQGLSYSEPSGIIEVDVRNNNGTLIQAYVSILAGNLKNENICVNIDSDGNLALYHNLKSEYKSVKYTLISDNSSNNNIFSFDTSFYGTTAPTSAIYAVSANLSQNSVTTDTDQTITASKTFLESQAIFNTGDLNMTIGVSDGTNQGIVVTKGNTSDIASGVAFSFDSSGNSQITAFGDLYEYAGGSKYRVYSEQNPPPMPSNVVTTNTEQTITSRKTFTDGITINSKLLIDSRGEGTDIVGLEATNSIDSNNNLTLMMSPNANDGLPRGITINDAKYCMLDNTSGEITPVYSIKDKVPLDAGVTGILPIANGGTGASTELDAMVNLVSQLATQVSTVKTNELLLYQSSIKRVIRTPVQNFAYDVLQMHKQNLYFVKRITSDMWVLTDNTDYAQLSKYYYSIPGSDYNLAISNKIKESGPDVIIRNVITLNNSEYYQISYDSPLINASTGDVIILSNTNNREVSVNIL